MWIDSDYQIIVAVLFESGRFGTEGEITSTAQEIIDRMKARDKLKEQKENLEALNREARYVRSN